MKREELKALGLNEAQIGTIMALHGRTISELNKKAALSKEEAEKHKGKLSEMQKQPVLEETDFSQKLSELQKQLTQTKLDSEKKIASIKKQAEIDIALTKAGAKNIKAAKALIDSDSVEVTEAGITGLDEQLNDLKEKESYLFLNDTAAVAAEGKKVTFEGNPSGNMHPELDLDAQMIAAMTNDVAQK
jgi:hypothetical protein